MPVPSPSLAGPSSLPPDGMYFEGVQLGPTTPFQLKKLEGLDLPDQRSGNVNWSMWPGASVGSLQSNTRKITLTLDVGPLSAGSYGAYGSLAAATKALVAACSTSGTTEYPLWIQLPGMPFVCTYARVLKTNFPWDITADLGGLLQNGTIQFECTDPYLYSAPSTSTSLGLSGPVGGFTFPLGFNLSFGGGSGGGNSATITNSGDVTCWPTLVITGPCLNPSISNSSIIGNPTISTSISLNAGDQLWIDCRLGAITLFPSGSTVGSPSQYVLNPGSEYFGLPPGSSSVTFNSADTSSVAGTLAVWSASAFDALL